MACSPAVAYAAWRSGGRPQRILDSPRRTGAVRMDDRASGVCGRLGGGAVHRAWISSPQPTSSRALPDSECLSTLQSDHTAIGEGDFHHLRTDRRLDGGTLRRLHRAGQSSGLAPLCQLHRPLKSPYGSATAPRRGAPWSHRTIGIQCSTRLGAQARSGRADRRSPLPPLRWTIGRLRCVWFSRGVKRCELRAPTPAKDLQSKAQRDVQYPNAVAQMRAQSNRR
jgi:hypothetical protein